MTKPLVFVSYAHAEPAEAALAGPIADRLQRDGAECSSTRACIRVKTGTPRSSGVSILRRVLYATLGREPC